LVDPNNCKAGTNGFTCLPKHGGAQDNQFLVTHPMINLFEADCRAIDLLVIIFYILLNYQNVFNMVHSLVWSPGQNKRIELLSVFHGCLKRRLKD
jgi:hypothetical protein